MASSRPVPYFRGVTRYESFQYPLSKTRAEGAAELGVPPHRVPDSWFYEKYGPPQEPDTFVYFSTSPRPRHKKRPQRPATEEDANFTLPGGPPLTRSFSSFSFAPPKDDVGSEPRAPQTGPTRSAKYHRRTRRNVTRDGSIHITEEGTREANDASDSDGKSNQPRSAHSTIPEEKPLPSGRARTATPEERAAKSAEAKRRAQGRQNAMPQARSTPITSDRFRPSLFQQMLDRAAELEREREKAEAEKKRLEAEFLREQRAREAEACEEAIRREEERLQERMRERRRAYLARQEEERRAREEAARRAEEERLERERAERERVEREKAEEELRRQNAKQIQDEEKEAAEKWYGFYEQTWASFQRNDLVLPPLEFDGIPWPIAYVVHSPSEITYDNIKFFVLYPNRPGCEKKTNKARVRAEMLRWHPDKFNNTTLPRVHPEHKAVIEKTADYVVKSLTRLLSDC